MPINPPDRPDVPDVFEPDCADDASSDAWLGQPAKGDWFPSPDEAPIASAPAGGNNGRGTASASSQPASGTPPPQGNTSGPTNSGPAPPPDCDAKAIALDVIARGIAPVPVP